MTDAEQPTELEAVEFWNSLNVGQRQRLVDGLDDPVEDLELVTVLSSRGMLFLTTGADEQKSAKLATESAGTAESQLAAGRSWSYARALQAIIDQRTTESIVLR